MIIGFRSKALRALYEQGDRSGLCQDLVPRIERILQRLDVATVPEQMNLPGWRLHLLKGELEGLWSVTVNGNWRIVFRWDGADATDVDLVDYH